MMTRPMLWPLLGLITGILASQKFLFSNLQLFFILLLSLFLLSCFYLNSKEVFQKILIAISSLLLFSVLGFWSAQVHFQKIEAQSLKSVTAQEKSYWLGKIAEPCQLKEEGAQYIVDLWEVVQESKISSVQGKVLLSVGEEESCSFPSGQVIQVYSKLKSPDSFRNRHAFDYEFYLKTQGITATSFVESKEYIARRNNEMSWLQDKLTQLRHVAGLQMDFIKDKDSKQMMKAMLLGSSQRINKDLEDAFRNTGTSHLLVVSGLHLAMVMGFLYLFFRLIFSLYPPLLLRVPVRQLSYWTALPFLIFYAVLVGFSPSVLRSLLSIILLGFLIIHKHSRNILSLLYLVAFILLFFQPLLLFDLPFQLSFLSLFSILILVPPATRYLEKRFPPLRTKKFIFWILEIILATSAVQIGLFPLLTNQFHKISLFALPANVILIPYFSFILMPLGMLGLFFSWLYSPASAFFFQSVSYFSEPVIYFVKGLNSISWNTHWLTRLSDLQILLYVSLVLIVVSSLEKRKKIFALLLLILLNCSAWFYPSWADSRRQDFRISFLDVGQGDAILLEFPKGVKMLVDAGGSWNSNFDIGEKVVLPALLDRGIRNLDYLVLSHPHPDHFLGMKSLLQAYTPREFWWNGQMLESEDLKSLLAALEKKGIPILQKNAKSSEIDLNGARIDFLYPPENFQNSPTASGASVNNNSLVMKIQDRALNVLLTGDIQQEAERVIARENELSPVDILKVPHHGSNTSSTEAFLQRFPSRYALIQAGRNNRFGFPKAEVMQAYQVNKSIVLGTYQNGEVEFIWDGKKLDVSCLSGCD